MRKLILSIALILAGTLGAAQENKVLIEPEKGTLLIKSENPDLLSFELIFADSQLVNVNVAKPSSGTAKPNPSLLTTMCRSFSCRRKPEDGSESKYNILDVSPDLLNKSITQLRQANVAEHVVGKRKIVGCNLLVAPYIMKLMVQELEEASEDKKSEVMARRKELANGIAKFPINLELDPTYAEVDFFKNYLPVLDSLYLRYHGQRYIVKKSKGKLLCINIYRGAPVCPRTDELYEILAVLEKFGVSHKDVLIRSSDRGMSRDIARLSTTSSTNLASVLPNEISGIIESYIDYQESTINDYWHLLHSHAYYIEYIERGRGVPRPILSDKAAREMLALVKRFTPNRSSQIGYLTERESRILDRLSEIEQAMDNFVARSQPRS